MHAFHLSIPFFSLNIEYGKLNKDKQKGKLVS
jgi:hypothetical protein